MTKTVSREEFEAFVADNCPMHVRDEPRIENSTEYKYECFDDHDGEEVAFISYKTGAQPVYTIR